MGSKTRFYVDIMDLHSEVTGSCHLCVIRLPNDEKIKFVVDCGLFQEKDSQTYNEKLEFNSEDVDFCLLTHNHVDHTGRLPLLVKKGFSGKIFLTETTAILLPLALKDTASILMNKAKATGFAPLYSDADVENTLNICTPCEYSKAITTHEYVKATFFENSHLLGAAMILVTISYPDNEDINLLFTGDFNNQSIFQESSDLPRNILDLPITVIQESTYGDMDSTEINTCFNKNILETIHKGGTALIPVFSLGRSQEVLYRLKTMQDTGILSTDIPIYLDGKLAIRYTELYLSGAIQLKDESKDFIPENFTYVDKEIRNSLLYGSNSSKIILTSSGMGSYGPARTYIPLLLGRKNVLIQFTGYTAEGTLGRKLQEVKNNKPVEIAGMVVKKQAMVKYTNEFSAHAKADTMIRFLQKFSNLKTVLVNHGSDSVKAKFAAKILEEVEAKQVGILNRETVFRVNTWGVVKTIPTKFI